MSPAPPPMALALSLSLCFNVRRCCQNSVPLPLSFPPQYNFFIYIYITLLSLSTFLQQQQNTPQDYLPQYQLIFFGVPAGVMFKSEMTVSARFKRQRTHPDTLSLSSVSTPASRVDHFEDLVAPGGWPELAKYEISSKQFRTNPMYSSRVKVMTCKLLNH